MVGAIAAHDLVDAMTRNAMHARSGLDDALQSWRLRKGL
jgi:hypothetical protein